MVVEWKDRDWDTDWKLQVEIDGLEKDIRALDLEDGIELILRLESKICE